MKVPYELYWQPARPASALLYPGDVAGLLRLCAAIGGATLPRIHAVGAGFLVVLDRPTDEAFPGAIRLRALAENLYLPVDAGLSPALLPDEARALGMKRGVVFLPGVEILTFDRDARVGPRELLRLPTLPRRDWRPPPARPARPEELTAIVLDLPPEAEAVLGEGIGEGTPIPPEAGPVAGATGGILSGLGRGLDKLGQWLDSETLRNLAGKMYRKAMQVAPALTEKLLGKHEATMRELLRRFRDGNLDDALRHAVPLGNEPGRGGTIDGDPRLVRREFRWSSADIKSPPGGSMWLSSDELHAELRQQYRRAADEAEAKGDFLRAAAIHGKLLGDWRRAASLLERAGRHHDAARVYLDRLGDPIAAARAYEAAGEIDLGVRLYVIENRPLEAADLLRRVGEEDRAMKHYFAAAQMETDRGNYAIAARLMTTRAGKPELAEPFLVQGWKARPSADAVECLHDLTDKYLTGEREAELAKLLDEADAHFAAPGDDATASRFYNRLVNRVPARDDLRDRALRGLARKLRGRAGEGDRGVGVVSLLFGSAGRWDAATVRDAEFALKAVRPAAPVTRKASRRIAVHISEVTAVSQAAGAGTLLLGFADGCLASYDSTNDRVRKLTAHAEPIVSASISPDGEFIALIRCQDMEYTLAAYEVHPEVWISRLTRPLDSSPGFEPSLTAFAPDEDQLLVGLLAGNELTPLAGDTLTPQATTTTDAHQLAAWFLPASDRHEKATTFIVFDIDRTFHRWRQEYAYELDSVVAENVPLPVELSSASFLSWNEGGGRSHQFGWLGEEKQACWMHLGYHYGKLRLEDSQLWSAEHCLAVTLLDAGRVAAVHARGVAWLRADGGSMRVQGRTEADLAEAVAAFASPKTGELLVVTRFGDIVRLPLPG